MMNNVFLQIFAVHQRFLFNILLLRQNINMGACLQAWARWDTFRPRNKQRWINVLFLYGRHTLKKLTPETCTDACDQNCIVWLVGCVWNFLVL